MLTATLISVKSLSSGDFLRPVVSCKNIMQQPLAGSVHVSWLSGTESADMFGLPSPPVA